MQSSFWQRMINTPAIPNFLTWNGIHARASAAIVRRDTDGEVGKTQYVKW
jgi:hypothetical protein